MNKCDSCPLNKFKHIVPPEGDITTAKYIIVGEAPGADEARLGRPFVGKSGRVLDNMLELVGINRDECYLTNVVKCRPPRNKLPNEAWLACQSDLADELAPAQEGTNILTVGTSARDALVPEPNSSRIMQSRGWYDVKCGDRRFNVCVGVHPAWILRDLSKQYTLYLDFHRFARGPLKVPVNPVVQIARSIDDLTKFVDYAERNFETGRLLYIDLETDQIDHQRDRVLCIAIAYAQNKVVVIPDGVLYTQEVMRKAQEDGFEESMINWKAVVQLQRLFDLDFRIGMHNGSFDLRFLIGQLHVTNARMDYDTLLMHYCLWEYPGTHGLKQLGQEFLDMQDWEKEVDKYTTSRGGRYSVIPRPVLYKYNAIDVEVGRRLCIQFTRELKAQGLWRRPFRFPIMAVVPMIVESELRGVYVHKEWMAHARDDVILPRAREFLAAMKDVIVPLAQDVWDDVTHIPSYMERYRNLLSRKISELDEGDRAWLKTMKGVKQLASGDVNPSSPITIPCAIYDVLEIPTVTARTISKGAKLNPRSTAKEAQDKIMDGMRTSLVNAILSHEHREEIFDELGLEGWQREALDTWAREWGALPKIMELDFDKWDFHRRVPTWVNKNSFTFMHNLREYRRAFKLISSYVDKFPNSVGPDGCVHPRFKLHGTITGRLSATDPPIQTIPAGKGEFGDLVPMGLSAPPGYVMVYADYSQAELRIAADITGDQFMRDAVNAPGSDFHTEVAKAIYGPNFTKEQRNWYCKRAVFGWLYGGNVFEIARDALRFPVEEAKRFSDDWNTRFAGAVAWRGVAEKNVLSTGEVPSPYGRKRHFYVITGENKVEAIHSAINSPIQSAASDNTLTAMYLLWRKYKDDPRVYLLTTVHDSCIVAVKDEPELVRQVAQDVTELMVFVASKFFPSVEHRADTKIGYRWATLEDNDGTSFGTDVEDDSEIA